MLIVNSEAFSQADESSAELFLAGLVEASFTIGIISPIIANILILSSP